MNWFKMLSLGNFLCFQLTCLIKTVKGFLKIVELRLKLHVPGKKSSDDICKTHNVK